MKKFEVYGSYRGVEDKIWELVGNDKRCEFIEDVNGDGNEYKFDLSIDKFVKLGEDIGLWEKRDGKLYEKDDEKWDELYDKVWS